MTDPAGSTGQKRQSSIRNDNPLKYAFDGGFLPGASPPKDTPEFEDGGGESDQSSESDAESSHAADLAESLREFSKSMLRIKLEELEMIKEREVLRLEAEKRRMELENQLTQMMMQTQLQIASFVCQKSSNRKRKRSDDANLGASERDGALLMMSLLHCNLISGLDRIR
ncbi:hypothetical protein M9H77_13347 [Catharanthus roseus]|uniref:Uncharacterized protein n=1 Tax=Catharanthus roseus TaxID=4058 RepID=A0ACC0BK61_CATRO|nr:hypothetical protein M9H77_13347 [Catharanthus roseus]